MAGSADFEDLRNATIILFIVTSFVTSYRCYARYTKKLWWHDDSVALFSAFSFTLFLTGSAYLADESSSDAARITACYILIAGFYVSVWGGRVSILLTVIRITPWHVQKRALQWAAVAFVLQFAMLIVQAYWVCELTHTGWKQIQGSTCILPRVVPISQVVTTVLSDATLIIAPLMIVKGVHIKALRFRLFSIFSVSIATTFASLAHAILVMVSPGVWETIFGGVEAAVSIIVCSMSVVIPAVLRALGVGDPFMQEDTVALDLGTGTGVEIARTTSTMIELGFPSTRITEITDSDECEEVVGRTASRLRGSVDLGVKDSRIHQLSTQASDASLGNLTTKVTPIAGKYDITDSLLPVRSFLVVENGRDIEADVEGKGTGRDSA